MVSIVDNDSNNSRRNDLEPEHPAEQADPTLADWLIVIPARFASSRLPGKPLADLAGVPLVIRVARNLEPLIRAGARLVVAVDDPAVEAACVAHGVPVVMTKGHHATGTDRCLEAARVYRDNSKRPVRWVLNVQGDEPFISPEDLLSMCTVLQKSDEELPDSRQASPVCGALKGRAVQMASMFFKCSDLDRGREPSTVKVVCNELGQALYFSRSPIPYDRDAAGVPENFLVHMGVYAFRMDALEAFCGMPQGRLEQLEKLEQLRALEAGWSIAMFEAKEESLGIDTLADLEAARARLR